MLSLNFIFIATCAIQFCASNYNSYNNIYYSQQSNNGQQYSSNSQISPKIYVDASYRYAVQWISAQAIAVEPNQAFKLTCNSSEPIDWDFDNPAYEDVIKLFYNIRFHFLMQRLIAILFDHFWLIVTFEPYICK